MKSAEIGRLNRRPIPTESHSPLYHVFQLPHIPWIGIAEQQFPRLLGKPAQLLVELLSSVIHHMLSDDHHVFLPLPERWTDDRNDVEPVDEIFTESPLSHLFA